MPNKKQVTPRPRSKHKPRPFAWSFREASQGVKMFLHLADRGHVSYMPIIRAMWEYALSEDMKVPPLGRPFRRHPPAPPPRDAGARPNFAHRRKCEPLDSCIDSDHGLLPTVDRRLRSREAK